MSKQSYLGTHDAAQMACVTSRTMQRWASQYALGMKIGGTYRFDPEKLNAFLKGHQVETSAPTKGEIR